ncbi:MAG: retroviral-like aspartic protease family protein [Candidatus Eremiobacteraeota bacterium]|nr:retroviral-like aspartic protease family protein [Candidatus Eremiobacteraeota bacterium]
MNSAFFRIGALCAGLIFAFLSLPAAADEASDLLAKHKAFVGWQMGDGAIRTLRYVQTGTDAKQTVFDTAKVVRTGAIFRSARTNKKGETSNVGFTGRLFWETSENGFTHPIVGDVQKYEIATEMLTNEATAALTGTQKTSREIDGQTYPVVRVAAAGFPIDLYIDPKTGAYKRAVIDPGGTYESTINILAYSEILPGKKFISKMKQGDSPNVYERTSFKVNGPVTNEEFEPPAQTATWDFANAQPFPVTVTDNRLLVNAKVNGVPGRFILDTGSSDITLTADFVNRAHVKATDNGMAVGIGGYAKTRIHKVDRFEIGGNTLSNVIVTSMSAEFDRDKPDGLIGFDLFGGAIVKLDTDSQRMTILDPRTNPVDKTAGIPAIVDLNDQTPTVPMKVNGDIDINATLDSGDSYYVLFSQDLINHHGLRFLIDPTEEGYLSSHVVLGGIGGYEMAGCGHLDKVSLGPIVYENAPSCVSGSFSERGALLGFDFFKHFNYVFDYPEATIVFIPHKE